MCMQLHRMTIEFLLLTFLCVTVSAQESKVPAGNETSVIIPYNEIINTIDNETEYKDSIDNIKFACSLTLVPYNETEDGDKSKVHTKLRLATVCCPGYKRNHRGICQPYCTGGCGDGFCEFPEICSCPPNCAFNTVDRKCVCFAAVCPGGCPANHTCVADNICECSQGFIQSNNWTKQYTNSSMECVPYCFPFCTNKLFIIPERCECNYTADGNDTDSGNGTLEGFDGHRKSHAYLGGLFQSYGHPSFASGLAGFGLGALVGGMIGSRGKNKYKYGKDGKVYGMPGMGYNQGYGMPGQHYGGGGYGAPGGYGNAGHGYPGYNPGGSYPGQGNYPGSYAGQGANYGHGVPPNTNYGPGGSYGQVPGQGVPGHGVPGHGVPGNTNPSAPYPPGGQNTGGVYGAGVPGQTHTQTHTQGVGQGNVGKGTGSNIGWNVPGQGTGTAGNVGQSPGTNYGWNVPGQGTQGTGVNAGTAGNVGQSPVTNYGSNTPGQVSQGTAGNAGKTGQTPYGWSVPGQAGQGTNVGSNTNTGQRTNPGWTVPGSTNTGGTSGTGTGSAGKGSSSGGSWWNWGSSGKGNSGGGGGSGNSGSGNSGRGSSGRKRGRKH